MMIFTTNAQLLCVIFFCGLKEVVHSQYGRCAEDQCYALFQTPENFAGAQTSCEQSDGQLFVYNSEEIKKILMIVPRGLIGSYWLEPDAEEAAAGVQNCTSISLPMGQPGTLSSRLCHEKLDGFLCQYTVASTCSKLRVAGGAQVKYTAMGTEVFDSDKFPPGTIAVSEKVNSKYPDSKHVCLDYWFQAPWNCEVLQGGCEYTCVSQNGQHTCGCPPRQTLHPNNITCSKDPCALCTQGCQQEGNTFVCKCDKGYRLAQDNQTCVDVNECEERDECTGEGEECMNTLGDFDCRCRDGLVLEDGVCVDMTICDKCEHMLCDKISGVYQCLCRKGFKVSVKDPTRCEMHCTERDCLANCIPNPDNNKPDMLQCFCPEGYILDNMINPPICSDIDECESGQCAHQCENAFGGYECFCNEGYKPHKKDKCILITEEEEEEDNDGSGSALPIPTAASSNPEPVPYYIKTGSVLGITMFLMLCVGLLFFLAQNMAKRCGKLELSSLKHQNIDVFYLQQVTTDTYKRLSFDKQLKNDPQILESHS